MDIFSETDLGDGSESTFVADTAAEAPVTQDSHAVAEPATPTDGLATTADQGDQAQDDTQQQQPTEQEAKTPEQVVEDEAKLEQEVEAALADEKTPKWFKNVTENVLRPRLAEAKASVEKYSQFGTPEEVAARAELLNGLDTIRSNPQTGMPERTTEPFVKGLYEKDPQGAYQLMTDLVTLPSPYSEGRTVLEEIVSGMGIDPARIEDVKRFAANGYQMQAGEFPPPTPDALESIPSHLHATFAKLDPETRESVLYQEQAVCNRTLEAFKTDFETKERNAHETQTQEQQAAEQEAQKQAQFKQQVDTKGDENFEKSGEAVLNGFVESLAKQAGMSKMDSLAIANTVLNAFEPTLAGRSTLAALKAEGIEVDPSLSAAINELQEAGKHVAYYQIIGDQTQLATAVAKQVGLQEKILAKGNKIISQLALKRNGNVIGQVQQNAAALAQTQNSRHATAGAGAQVNSSQSPSYDYSEEGYMESLGQDPFFRR